MDESGHRRGVFIEIRLWAVIVIVGFIVLAFISNTALTLNKANSAGRARARVAAEARADLKREVVGLNKRLAIETCAKANETNQHIVDYITALSVGGIESNKAVLNNPLSTPEQKFVAYGRIISLTNSIRQAATNFPQDSSCKKSMHKKGK